VRRHAPIAAVSTAAHKRQPHAARSSTHGYARAIARAHRPDARAIARAHRPDARAISRAHCPDAHAIARANGRTNACADEVALDRAVVPLFVQREA
jgi:hypothetical protein